MGHPAHIGGHHDDDYTDQDNSRSATPYRRSHEIDVEAQNRVLAPEPQNETSKVQFQIHEPEVPQSDGTTDDSQLSPSGLKRSGTTASKEPSIKSLRRRGRSSTQAVGYEPASGRGTTSGWAPGQEPGLDTSDPAPPYSQGPIGNLRHPENLHQKCGITVVDYSSDFMVTTDLDNDNLEDFLKKPQEPWVEVRWINVDGLSWDVIRLLGNYKDLHRLAIEDLTNTNNRTKADYYHDHTFMILPLQKLVNTEDDEASDDEADDPAPKSKQAAFTEVMTEKQKRNRKQRHAKNRRGAIKTLFAEIMKPKQKKKGPHHHHHPHLHGGLHQASSFNRFARKDDSPWATRKVSPKLGSA